MTWREGLVEIRRGVLRPEVGWAAKAIDVWLQLTMAQRPQHPFQSAVAAGTRQSTTRSLLVVQ